MLTAWEPKYHSEDWRAAASDLGPPRVDRVVIATPGSFARKPLQFYLPGSRALSSSGEPVGEVDVLALPRQGSTEPTGATLHLSMPRLRLVARDFDGRFVVWRYRPTGRLRLSLGGSSGPAGRAGPGRTSSGRVVDLNRGSTGPAAFGLSFRRTIQNASQAVNSWRSP